MRVGDGTFIISAAIAAIRHETHEYLVAFAIIDGAVSGKERAFLGDFAEARPGQRGIVFEAAGVHRVHERFVNIHIELRFECRGTFCFCFRNGRQAVE